MIYIFLLLISATHLLGAGDDDSQAVRPQSKTYEELYAEVFGSDDSDSEAEEPPCKKSKLSDDSSTQAEMLQRFNTQIFGSDSDSEAEESDDEEEGMSVEEFIATIYDDLHEQNPDLGPLYSTADNSLCEQSPETEKRNLKLILFCAFGEVGVSNAVRGRKQFIDKIQNALFSRVYLSGLTPFVTKLKPHLMQQHKEFIQAYALALQHVLGLSIQLSTEGLLLDMLIQVCRAFLNELAGNNNKFFYVKNHQKLKELITKYRNVSSTSKRDIKGITEDFLALRILKRKSLIDSNEAEEILLIDEEILLAIEEESSSQQQPSVFGPQTGSCNPNNLQGQKMPEDDDTEEEDESFFQGNNPNGATSSDSQSTTSSQTSSTNSNDKYKTCASSRRSVFDPQLFNRLLNIEEEERIRVDPQADPSIQEEQRHQRFLQLVRQRTSHPGRVRFLFNLYDLRNQYPDLWQEVLDEENPPLEVRREDRLLELEMNRIVDFTKEQENYATFLEATGRFVYYIGGEIVNRLAFILTTGLLIKTQEILIKTQEKVLSLYRNCIDFKLSHEGSFLL